jgi:hypothetical protein
MSNLVQYRQSQVTASPFPPGMLCRNFQPKGGVEFLQIKFGRKQLDDLDAEDFGEKQQFAVRRAPELGFQFGHGFTADIPAFHLQPCRECFLGPVLLIAELPHRRAD